MHAVIQNKKNIEYAQNKTAISRRPHSRNNKIQTYFSDA